MREPPGPGMWETYRRLRHTPLRQFPTFLFEMQREYGDVVAFRVPWRRFYFLNDSEAIKDVLITHQHAFIKSEGTRALGELLGQGLVTSEDPLHRRMRRIVQPAFHRERIAGYAQTMRRFAESWRAPDGIFDMHAAMTELTLRVASTTLFGADAGSEAERVSNALKDVVRVFPNAIGPFAWIRRKFPFGAMGRFRDSRQILNDIVMRLIAERRRSGEDRGDALSMLLASRDEDTGELLDDAQVRDEVMTLFVAGHETTANALVWTWYLLAKNPEAAQSLSEQKYVDAVLSETLRLYPPVWILGRNAKREVEAAGWRIRPKAAVLMSQMVMHRNPRYFERPDEFLPDRWLEDHDLPQFAYFPFGGGSRRCIGDQFAWMEAAIVLSTLGSRYRFERATTQEVQPMPIVTLRPDGPVLMRAVPR